MDLFIPKPPQKRPVISHTTIHPEVYGIPRPRRVKSILSEVNTGDPVFAVHTVIDGSKHADYHVNLIKLLDKVFLGNNLGFLSIEQERFMNKFFEQAGIVTNVLDNNISQNKDDDPFADMDLIFRELDNFLGSYYGVDYGRFAR